MRAEFGAGTGLCSVTATKGVLPLHSGLLSRGPPLEQCCDVRILLAGARALRRRRKRRRSLPPRRTRPSSLTPLPSSPLARAQSVTAYHTAEKQMETARKDLTPLVSKARANLDSLSESTKAEFARLAEVSAAAGGGVGAGVVIGADGMPVIIDEPVQQRDTKGKGVDPGERGEEAESDDVNPGAAAAAFFAKLQSQVAANPNVQGLSKNLATLQHSVTTNLTTLPTSLQANLTTLQTRFDHLDLSDTVQQGEHWFADFSNEVQRLALDAVKVVPPEVEAGMRDERSRKREERLRKAEQVAVGRRDALVLRLRQDRQGFLVDPEEGEGRASFVAFLEGVKEQGGFEGESWLRRVAEEVEVGGEGLVDLVAGVVGTHAEQLTRDQFWSRYFWRVGQIDEDEERRRKVLEGECSTRARVRVRTLSSTNADLLLLLSFNFPSLRRPSHRIQRRRFQLGHGRGGGGRRGCHQRRALPRARARLDCASSCHHHHLTIHHPPLHSPSLRPSRRLRGRGRMGSLLPPSRARAHHDDCYDEPPGEFGRRGKL